MEENPKGARDLESGSSSVPTGHCIIENHGNSQVERQREGCYLAYSNVELEAYLIYPLHRWLHHLYQTRLDQLATWAIALHG